MSALTVHAQAARILAQAYREKAQEMRQGIADTPDDHRAAMMAGSLTIWGMAEAQLLAADRMDEAARAELVDHSCTVNHATMQIPKCIACGAPRAKR